MSYIFNRDSSSVQPDYADLQRKGLTVALNSEDPDLANQFARARANGQNPAIWIPAHQVGDPQAFAQHMAQIVRQYGPSAILPNLEGSPVNVENAGAPETHDKGWSRQMMDAYSKLVPPGQGPPLGVTVEGHQGWFNYKPFLEYGGFVNAESFTNGPDTPIDWILEALHNAGVPDDRINLLLGPGQSRGEWKGAVSAYTLDDLTPDQWQTFLNAHSTTQQMTGGDPRINIRGQGQPIDKPNKTYPNQLPPIDLRYQAYTGPRSMYGPVKPGAPLPDQNFTQRPIVPGSKPQVFGPPVANPNKVDASKFLPDSINPAAQSFARKKLAEAGIHVSPIADAAAAWRNYLANPTPRGTTGDGFTQVSGPPRPGAPRTAPAAGGGTWTQVPNQLPNAQARLAARAAPAAPTPLRSGTRRY